MLYSTSVRVCVCASKFVSIKKNSIVVLLLLFLSCLRCPVAFALVWVVLIDTPIFVPSKKIDYAF